MKHSTKVILNTIATFARIIVNGLCTLLATRIVLNILGASDYGLYTLLAGTVAMMTFINSALTISAQRFFSISLGRKSTELLNHYYNASIGIHFIIGVTITVILLGLIPFLFNGFLNIESEQRNVGIIIYSIMTFSTVLTVATIPFSALMNAHEDLTILSIIDILSCVIKLIAAIVLLYIDSNHLFVYSCVIFLSFLFKAIADYGWCKFRYKNVHIKLSQLFNKTYTKEMLGFVSWNTLGSLSSVAKGQGISILLNLFFGTIINATYGISHQINAIVTSFSSALMMVFTPMITKAKGENNNQKMIDLALLSSKMAFCISTVMALPLLLNLDEVLKLWLNEVPEDTNTYCFFTILCFLIGQIDAGLNRSIYAEGKIKGYQIWMSIVIVSILPIGYVLFKCGLPAVSIVQALFICQILLMVVTLYFANKHCHFNISQFLIKIVFPEMAISVFAYLIFVYIKSFIHLNMIPSIIISSVTVDLLFVLLFAMIILNCNEKKMVKEIVYGFTKKRVK